MNRIITDSASPIKGQPLIADSGIGSIPFLQDGVAESIWSMLVGIIGPYNTNDLIVIDGVVITLSNSNNTATWTKGAIGYNGEIYTVDAGTVTKTGGQSFVYQTLITYSGTLDPVIMSDNTSASVHQVRKITILAGASGSGIADYGASSVKVLNGWHTSTSTTGATYSGVGTGSISFVYTKWSKRGNICTFNYTIVANLTGNTTSTFTVTLPLPIAAVAGDPYYTQAQASVFFTDSGTTEDSRSALAQIQTPGTLSVKFNGSIALPSGIVSAYGASASAEIDGQISYQV